MDLLDHPQRVFLCPQLPSVNERTVPLVRGLIKMTAETETLMIQYQPRKSGLKIKCAKCGVTAEQEPSLRFHRFPLPRARGSLRTRAWAEYAFPDKDWTCEQDLVKLYNMHTMLCCRHFDDSAYTSSAKTRLNVFALPSGAADMREFQEINETQTDHDYAVGIYRPPVGIKPSAARRPNAAPSVATVESQRSPFTPGKSTQESEARLVRSKNEHNALSSKRFDDDAFSGSCSMKLNKDAVTPHPEQQTANHENNQCDDTQADVLHEDEVEVKQEEDELAHVCRVCMRYCSDAQEMAPLLRGGELTEAGNALTAFCPQVKISACDNLPLQMCDACTREAVRAERFYRRVEETHARLATLAPHDIVQYSLSLAHYFPERIVSDKLGEDDETAVISLRYDGDQHLELSFNNKPSPSVPQEAEENPEEKTAYEENRKRKMQTTMVESASDPPNIFFKKRKKVVQFTSDPKDDINSIFDEGDALEDLSLKEEPLFETSGTMTGQGYPGYQQEAECDQLESATEVDITFVCPECKTDFVTCLEAERHMQSAHGPVTAYVCYECSQTIATKRLLRDHLRRHSRAKPYECQRCSNKFYSQGDRRSHYVVCAVKSADVH